MDYRYRAVRTVKASIKHVDWTRGKRHLCIQGATSNQLDTLTQALNLSFTLFH